MKTLAAVLGIVAAWAVQGLVVMVGFGMMHDRTPEIPALGYQTSLMLVVVVGMLIAPAATSAPKS